jgi:tetrapyrrole methylase family protein / MazG family protein
MGVIVGYLHYKWGYWTASISILQDRCSDLAHFSFSCYTEKMTNKKTDRNIQLPPVDENAISEFVRLYGIITKLRDPGGCPWDIEQTPETMRENLLEEAYECVNAIDNHDDANLCEELGDLFLDGMMIVRMAEQEKKFTLEQVFSGISEKLIRRHPHVFGDSIVGGSEEVVTQWDKIKEEVEGKKNTQSILASVSRSLPPLERALEIQKKAAKTGFDWNESAPIVKKLEEEIGELEHALACSDAHAAEEEFGDILFTIVNIARFASINPSIALNRTNEKFTARFKEIEKRLMDKGIPIKDAGLELMDSLWNEIKKEEKTK